MVLEKQRKTKQLNTCTLNTTGYPDSVASYDAHSGNEISME